MACRSPSRRAALSTSRSTPSRPPQTLPSLSRIRKPCGLVDSCECLAYFPFTRSTATELPGKVWRMADSPTLMPNMAEATFDGLASKYSSVGLSEESTTALAGPIRRAMPSNPMFSRPGGAGVVFGPGTVAGSHGQIQRCGVV